ncbi:hypothetical protein KJ359_009558 [Pestalotiopsis sp. 9143b]|nr:hypothetical protein KJ359_009558 [Pestalotiopsis sp. 9143b]
MLARLIILKAEAVNLEVEAAILPAEAVNLEASIQKEWRVYAEQKEQKRQQEELNESKKRKREETKAARAAKKPANTPAKADQAELDEANGTVAELRGALTELRRVHQSLEEKLTSSSKQLETANSDLNRVNKEYRAKVAEEAALKEELGPVKKDYRDKVADVAVQKEELLRQQQQQEATFHRTKADMEQKERALTLVLNANDELNKNLKAFRASTPAMEVLGSNVDQEQEIATLKAHNSSLKTEYQTLKLEFNALEGEFNTLEGKNQELNASVKDLDFEKKSLDSKKKSLDSYMLHYTRKFHKFADDLSDIVNGKGRFQDLDPGILDHVETLESGENDDDVDGQVDHDWFIQASVIQTWN